MKYCDQVMSTVKKAGYCRDKENFKESRDKQISSAYYAFV